GRLDERARDILVHGVRREQGGLASQHVLDVEVYQDFLDPAAGRMWSWIFGERERPSDYNAAELFASIQEAQRGSESKRYMADAVFEKLVALGRDTWQSRIVGRESVKGIDDLGLSIVAGVRDEAHKAIAWSRVKRHFPEGRPDRFEGADRESWERALESVTENEVEDYVSQKLAEAAKKCQPFLQLGEGATEIPAKKYVTVSAVYLDDARFRSMLTSISAFQVAVSSLLKSADPKKLVFYWNEMGVTVYTIRSIDEYGNRYEFVKDSELRRGREYRRSEVPYVSSHPRFDEHAAHCEGRKCPDIPLHIDKWWEGAPDEAAVLMVFYSGHADQEALRMNGTRLPVGDLRALVQGSAAAVRLLVLDACRSGGVTRTKGGRKGPSFDIRVDSPREAQGLVIVTSSAAGED
ncbi:MAG: hypothetical protein HYZ27_10005, partial [Deltaproteobacteria bacterium]|nr:hypothetical protein [Deltaproteobacteria bacterium]